jgi:hypothetical protein
LAKKEAIYIGATIVGAEDADSYFGPVKVPGSMSKQETIDRHIAKVETARAGHAGAQALGFAGSLLPNDDAYENHAHRPMVGLLASVSILDNEGVQIYHQAEKGQVARGKVALPLINYLQEAHPKQFGDSLRFGDAEPSTIFFGFNLKQIFRIAAFEVLRHNMDNAYPAAVPVRLWHNPAGVYDVLDVLLSANDQRDLDLYSLLRYFDVKENAESLSKNSLLQAEAAMQLVKRAQLVPRV